MTELEKVIKSFETEIASKYTCKDKKSKYAKDFDDHMEDWDWYNGRKCGFDWCTCFFDWNFVNALGVDRARKVLNRPHHSMGAGVRYSREYLKSLGRVGDIPKVGCAVYFGSLPYPRHIGFVYKVTDTYIYTYEGNCYVSSGVSGVKARSYKRTNADILDYGYPVYSDEPGPDPKELDGYKVGNTYEVYCGDDPLMIRKGPGTSFASIGSLKTGDKIVCTGLSSDAKGNTWLKFDAGWSCGHYGDKRYLDEPKKEGWIKEDNLWYYYTDGKMIKCDWVKWKGRWYYLGPDGAMVVGWQDIDGKTYYFYPGNDGHMASNEWIERMWLNKDGSQTYPYLGEWKSNSKGKWYEDESGWYPREESQRIDKVDYMFDKRGYLVEQEKT